MQGMFLTPEPQMRIFQAPSALPEGCCMVTALLLDVSFHEEP